MPEESQDERLVRIETKLDSMFDRLVKDHEERIRLLEKWRYALPIAFFFAVASTVVSLAAIFVKLG